jgi:hypothetical protein
MKLSDLSRDPRTSLDSTSVPYGGAYDEIVRHLRKYGFWKRESSASPLLWEHQRVSIALACAYIAADPRIPDRPTLREAALLKLPTGTGKSGIVAVLSRCVPKARCILVLVPREAIRDQLLDDITWRFWLHLGYAATEKVTFVGDPVEIRTPLEPAYIDELLPSTVNQLYDNLANRRRRVPTLPKSS